MARCWNTTRRCLKGSAGAMALAMGGGAPFLSSGRPMRSGDLADQQLRTIGLSVTVQDRILADFKQECGVGIDDGHGRDLPRRADQDPVGLERLRLLGSDRRAASGRHRDQQCRADPGRRDSRTGLTSATPSRSRERQVGAQGADRRPDLGRRSADRALDGPGRLQLQFHRLQPGGRQRRGSQYLDRDLRRQVEGQVGPQHRSADRLRPGHHGA